MNFLLRIFIANFLVSYFLYFILLYTTAAVYYDEIKDKDKKYKKIKYSYRTREAVTVCIHKKVHYKAYNLIFEEGVYPRSAISSWFVRNEYIGEI